MAVEKLMLRSVLYGVDKIPDTWFEKVPGGFFKPGNKEADANGQRNAGSEGGQRSNNANDGRKYREEDDYDDGGYRSEGRRRRHERSRSSYDGGADDDDYYVSGDERRRRRSGRSHRRRHSLDDDRRGYDDSHRRGHHRDSRDGYIEGRRSYDRAARPPDPYYDRERPSTGGSNRSANPFAPGSYAAAGAAMGATAGNPPHPQSGSAQSPPIQSPGVSPPPQPRSGSVGNGYVPYAHLYGQQSPYPPQQPVSPPLSSSLRSPHPSGDRDVSPSMAPPPRGYQQNPFAQQAPTAEAAGAGAEYTGEAGIRTNQDPRWANGPDPYYSARLYTGYGENYAQHPNSASPRRSSRRDYSPSYDSYDSRAQDRRSRSERRDEDKSKAQGKSKSRVREVLDKSRVKESFDTSERGLGYGAIGALAGGLFGSEFGKGPIPKVLGAAVGGLGANAYEAREKYVNPRQTQNAQMPTQPTPSAMNR